MCFVQTESPVSHGSIFFRKREGRGGLCGFISICREDLGKEKNFEGGNLPKFTQFPYFQPVFCHFIMGFEEIRG